MNKSKVIRIIWIAAMMILSIAGAATGSQLMVLLSPLFGLGLIVYISRDE
jgi:hypothetical protein